MLVLASMALIGAATAASAAPASLAAHRAVYDLSLKDASERSGISGMAGRMVYEFNGSPCDGYTVSFRFVTEIVTADSSRVTDQQTTTYEDIRNRKFDFSTRSFVNQDLDREVRGSASGEASGLQVELAEPKQEKLELAGAHFPTEHMMELIDKARSGERFYESRIFDGSDDANELMITTTVIGALEKTPEPGSDAEKAGELAGQGFWPVTISYFNDKKDADGLPVYTISFKMYENGVTRDLTMDYGDFVLEGRLAELDMLKAEPCKE
nr:cell envelope integrity EipB family protein [Hoeflea marina]